uniref:Ig-like domain-containing protein n=1 Tax=Paramormyrops kingsleyae TaxID=1676925 RepID=A0A3B3RDD4_9TELE
GIITIKANKGQKIPLHSRPTVSVSWVDGPSGDSALLCSVQDFYPESIEQVWLRDGLPLNVTPDRRSTVNPDGSYTLDSYLSLTAAHAEDVLCSCWVNHSSLDLPLNYTFQCKEHKTGAHWITIISPRHILISVLMGRQYSRMATPPNPHPRVTKEDVIVLLYPGELSTVHQQTNQICRAACQAVFSTTQTPWTKHFYHPCLVHRSNSI